MCLFVIFYVLLVYMLIKYVSLLGDEAGLTDQELEHRLIGSIVSAGG